MITLETIGLFLIFLGTLLVHFEQRVYAHIDCFGPIYDVADNLCSFAGSLLAPITVDSHFNSDYRHGSRPWSNRRRRSRPFFRRRPGNAKRNSSGIANQRGQHRYNRIRNKSTRARHRRANQDPSPAPTPAPSTVPNQAPSNYAVSYTHLTLPTILLV